jgi:hypothetical protein
MVVAGFAHPICTDQECPHFDAEAAAEFDRLYAEEAAKTRARMLAMACRCKRCKRSRKGVSDEVLEEIVFHLLHVLKPEAIKNWFHIYIPRLKGSAVVAFEQDRVADILALVRSYEDPSFG